MRTLKTLTIGLIWCAFVGSAMGQVKQPTVSSVRQEIEREATTLLAKFGQKNYEDEFWRTVRRFSQTCKDFSVEELIGPGGLTQPFGERLPREARAVATGLAAYALVEVVDKRVGSRLGPYVKRTRAYSRRAVIAAVGTCPDEQAREWLFDLAMDGDLSSRHIAYITFPSESYFALQLLRGYEPEPLMLAKIKQLLKEDLQTPTDSSPQYITRAQALRSLLSSWDYSASLDDVTKKRYRDFQSRMWRYFACTDLRSRAVVISVFGCPAAELLKEWQPGDEQFVLHVFEDEHATKDEAEIALYLVHKLSDTAKLQAIADGDSPQAPLAKQALSAHRYMNSIQERDGAR